MVAPPADALFHPDGDRFVPTELGASPWGPDSLHGGAPAALLARAIERHDDDGAAAVGVQLTRMAIDIVRPVPLAPLRVETRTVRPGRRVQLIEATLFAADGDVVVSRAMGLRLHDIALALPEGAVDGEPAPPPPEGGHPFEIEWGWRAFHTDGMELRIVAGDFAVPGPCTAWFRLRVPVVAGETPTPFMRVAAAADFGNGLSQVLPMQGWLFINPDLTITVSRPPVGEWVCLAASSHLAEAGAGFAESALYDERGRIGRAVQSLLLDRR